MPDQKSRKAKRELIEQLIREFRVSGNQDAAFDSLAAERLGVSETDLHCLNIIENSGGLAAGELAAQAGLTAGAITGVIDRLENAGYASRVADPADRRRVRLKVTPRSTNPPSESGGRWPRTGNRPCLSDSREKSSRASQRFFARPTTSGADTSTGSARHTDKSLPRQRAQTPARSLEDQNTFVHATTSFPSCPKALPQCASRCPASLAARPQRRMPALARHGLLLRSDQSAHVIGGERQRGPSATPNTDFQSGRQCARAQHTP